MVIALASLACDHSAERCVIVMRAGVDGGIVVVIVRQVDIGTLPEPNANWKMRMPGNGRAIAAQGFDIGRDDAEIFSDDLDLSPSRHR